MADVDVTRNDEQSRYEAPVDGHRAVVNFKRRTDLERPVVVMTHTEVPEELRGEGIASELVQQALDDVRERGEKVVPECPFVSSWVDDHPEYHDLLERELTT